MSIRLYVGNLPQTFDAKELEALFSAVGEGVRFKAVNDRETGASRGFGFANVDDQKMAETVIEQLNGRDFGGSALRIEMSERRDSRPAAGDRRAPGASQGSPVARKAVNKVVHADSIDSEAPDPRWAGELQAEVPPGQPEGSGLTPFSADERLTPCRDDTWLWQDHAIRLTRCDGPDASTATVILIHGFGANRRHWRHNLKALAQNAEVIALDLLGFGLSDKPPSCLADEPPRPGSVRYGIELWAQQVQAAAETLVSPGRTLHLIGNSIGAVVALRAATLLHEGGRPPAQVILIDCAQRTLDDKRLAAKPAWAQATRPLLKSVVRQRWLIHPLFRFVAQPAWIAAVLRQAYPSGAGIDPELIQLLHEPSQEPGAMESFRGFINLFNDHLAPDLLAELPLPVRMIWGEADPWENVQEARHWAESYPCIQELVVLPGLGHCPHDEGPELVNPILERWLEAEKPA